MVTYVLLMMVWTTTYTGSVASAEFNSLANCEAAANAATAKFNGRQSSLFYVCVPK